MPGAAGPMKRAGNPPESDDHIWECLDGWFSMIRISLVFMSFPVVAVPGRLPAPPAGRCRLSRLPLRGRVPPT